MDQLKIIPLVVGQMQTNCYIVADSGTKETIIIDPGDDADYIIRIITDNKLTPKKIIATHPERLDTILPLILERIHTLEDFSALFREGEFGFFFETPVYGKTLLMPKNSSEKENGTRAHIKKLTLLFEKVSSENFSDSEHVKNAVWDYATEHGRGDVLWPMRVALSGREKSPDPFFIASVIGKDETISRLKSAVE